MDGLKKLAEFQPYMDVETDDCSAPVLIGDDDVRPARNPDAQDRCRGGEELPVYQAALPNGQRVPILKTLLTSVCENNCNYCAFRCGRDVQRTTFTPDEMAKTYMDLHRRGVVRGIFLSSGVAGGGVRTQDRLLDTAEILRTRQGYQGYLHLKIMPGSEQAQVERAMQLADRVSINLEGPTTERVNQLAPKKVLIDDLLMPLRWAEEIRRKLSPEKGWKGRWPSTTTQFVVGAAGESDLELLRASEYLFSHLHLARVYYSGFKPVTGTPLENHAAANPWRKNRLYQASFLLRDYGFCLEDMPFVSSGDLPLDVDPKLAWARAHLLEEPLEINRADLHALLRIPGIGPQSARAIVSARRRGRLVQMGELRALGIQTRRAAPFILLDGHRPAMQLSLW
jgi:predicted DNA-binding helix-hairpin-helix protein